MTVKLNTDYTISMLVADAQGNRIDNDSPVVTIKRVSDGEYWNGMEWVSSEAQLAMSLFSNGIYTLVYRPNVVGVMEITCQSPEYMLKNISLLYVYAEEGTVFEWKTGEPYGIQINAISPLETMGVKILRESDQSYFNGDSWDTEASWINAENDNGTLIYTFIPEEDTKYYIEAVSSEGQEVKYIIESSGNANTLRPVLISSSTFKSNDGSDSVIKNAMGKPIMGARVSFYDMSSDRKLAARSHTDSNGAWSLSVKPGKYYVLFEYDGYVSKGFERTVT